MTKLLLSLHVLAALLTIGPVAVAAGMFPAALRRTYADGPDDPAGLAALRTLHRICRVYAAVGIAVPFFGMGTASALGVLGSAWLITSIVLTAGAAAVLLFLILPAQDAALPPAVPSPRAPARLAMYTGVFNLLWATVTVLMIVRPGSTTGA